MGCDLHAIIQIFDIDLNKWILIKENCGDHITRICHEGFTLTIHKTPNQEENLGSMTSEQFDELLKEHDNCDDESCACKSNFYIHFSICRDYNFFSNIANVRGDDSGLIPKGLPTDLDDIVNDLLIENDDDRSYNFLHPADLHSHTYFYDHEIEKMTLDNSDGMSEFKKLLQRVKDNFPNQQSRFLICFDN